MNNYTAADFAELYNSEFRINTKALYAAVDNGSYDNMVFKDRPRDLYSISNRCAQVSEMFSAFGNGQLSKEVQTLTKGYAIAAVQEVVRQYRASKVVAPVVSEVEILKAQLAKSEAGRLEAVGKLQTERVAHANEMATSQQKLNRLENKLSLMWSMKVAQGMYMKAVHAVTLKQSV